MYKRLREITRRMPTYRGELGAIHPKFSADSPARCLDTPVAEWKAWNGEKLDDLVYSAEDDKAIEQWLRENVRFALWRVMDGVDRSAGGDDMAFLCDVPYEGEDRKSVV